MHWPVDSRLGVARRYAEGALGLAEVDFQRNGYRRLVAGPAGSSAHLHDTRRRLAARDR